MAVKILRHLSFWCQLVWTIVCIVDYFLPIMKTKENMAFELGMWASVNIIFCFPNYINYLSLFFSRQSRKLTASTKKFHLIFRWGQTYHFSGSLLLLLSILFMLSRLAMVNDGYDSCIFSSSDADCDNDECQLSSPLTWNEKYRNVQQTPKANEECQTSTCIRSVQQVTSR